MPRARRDGSPAAEPHRHKLSDIFIRKLKPQSRPFMVWDVQQRGLAVAVQPTGHKSWKVVYSMNGRPRWYTIGDVAAIGLSDARKLASRVMFQVAEGKDPAAERKAERRRGTFQELATAYVKDHAMKRNRCWKQADRLVQKHLIPKWGKLKAAAITRSDVTAMIVASMPPSLPTKHSPPHRQYLHGQSRKKSSRQIPASLSIAIQPRPASASLSDVEIPKFWAAFDDAGLVVSTALKFILLTGQRPGEVVHMHREHIVDGWWTMPGDPVPQLDWPRTKNGHMIGPH